MGMLWALADLAIVLLEIAVFVLREPRKALQRVGWPIAIGLAIVVFVTPAIYWVRFAHWLLEGHERGEIASLAAHAFVMAFVPGYVTAALIAYVLASSRHAASGVSGIARGVYTDLGFVEVSRAAAVAAALRAAPIAALASLLKYGAWFWLMALAASRIVTAFLEMPDRFDGGGYLLPSFDEFAGTFYSALVGAAWGVCAVYCVLKMLECGADIIAAGEAEIRRRENREGAGE